MRLLRWLGIALVALVTLLVGIGVAARFSDGPIGPFPGGSLTSGEVVSDSHVDWTFATDVAEIEFELLEPPRSRTTWIVVHEGQPYVPCGFLDVPLWKQWPHEALRDGRAVLRIDGRRYDRQAVRVTDPELYAAVVARVAEKYGLGSGEPDPELVWIFRLDPRRSS